MIQSEQWQSLLHLQPSDFSYPDKLDWSMVSALDQFISLVGSRPQILDDWRSSDPQNPKSQHLVGKAVDTTWPGKDSIAVLNLALESRLWTGVGMYVNEMSAVSFHFDTRDGLATWGGVITHPYDSSQGKPVKRIEYTALATVVNIVKKNILPLTTVLILCGLGLWILHNGKI